MNLASIAPLMEKLAAWRLTEAAAAQDVRDAQANVAALDLRLQDALARHSAVIDHLADAERDLASAIMDSTAPPSLIFTQGE